MFKESKGENLMGDSKIMLQLIYQYPLKFLKALSNGPLYLQQIKRKTSTTAEYVCKISRKMLEKGIIEIIPGKNKRVKVLSLTKRGRYTLDLLKKIEELVK